MKVEFIQERLVGERTFRQGDVADLPDEVCKRLLAGKIVVDAGPAKITVFAPAPTTEK